jgi:hypothetical protein
MEQPYNNISHLIEQTQAAFLSPLLASPIIYRHIHTGREGRRRSWVEVRS